MQNYIQILIGIFLIISALFAGFSKKTLHSVLFLIITFIFSAFLLFFYELEFLGLALLIVYVGAIAILFLFVIMMVNEKN